MRGGPLEPGADLLPAVVRWADTTAHLADPLFEEEEAYLTRVVDKRRREFTTARACARRALATLGLERGPMVPGLRGCPPWPAGVVGSLTHTEGYAAAAVAPAGLVGSIGIDAEPDEALPDGVLELVVDDVEQTHLRSLRRAGAGVAWDRLAFSAKESVYKAWFPVRGEWLDFLDVQVFPHPDGTFELSVPADRAGGVDVAGLLAQMSGRWARRGDHLVTGVVLPPRGVLDVGPRTDG